MDEVAATNECYVLDPRNFLLSRILGAPGMAALRAESANRSMPLSFWQFGIRWYGPRHQVAQCVINDLNLK